MAQSINGFVGEYRWLSNFWESPFLLKERWFPTVEHYYQSQKANNVAEFMAIIGARSPANAKAMGKSVRLSPDWSKRRVEVMRIGVYCKFKQNPSLQSRLLETGDARIIEVNTWGDTFWGVCKHKGRNTLGKMLEELRSSLQGECAFPLDFSVVKYCD